MIFLLLSICCSVALAMVFKVFERYTVNLLNAIVINYWVCVLVGSLVIGHLPISSATWSASWLPFALVLGILFIMGFYWMGRSIYYFGMTITTVSQRISLILPICFAFWIYQEPITFFKVFGIGCALIALYLINLPYSYKRQTLHFEPSRSKSNRQYFYFPVLVFFVSGIIGILLQYVQKYHFTHTIDNLNFTIFLFGTAGVLGLLVWLSQVFKNQFQLQKNDIIAGILLGLPNLGTVVFFLKAFEIIQQGSVLFPLNDVGVLVGVSLLAYFIFNEKLSKFNWIGLALAVLAIGLISWQ